MREKWKKKCIAFQLFISTLFLFGNKIVYADDTSYKTGIEQLDRYTSKLWVPSEFIGFGDKTAYLINSLVQAIFWLTKIIFFVCAKIYEQLSTTDGFDKYITIALDIGAQIYSALAPRGQFGLLSFIGVFIALYVAYIFFVKNGSFVKTLLKLLLVFGLSSSIFMKADNGQYVLKNIYIGINTITTEIAGLSETKVASLKQGDTSVVLNQYFKMAVWESYKYLNAEATEVDGKVTFSPNEEDLKILLKYDSGDKEFKVGEKYIYDYVGEKDKVNYPMLAGQWGKKFTYAFVSVIDSLIMGIILDVFAVASFSTRLMIILMLGLSGFIAILSMIPTLENILFNFFKKLFGFIMASGLFTLGSIMFLWLYSLLNEIITTIFPGNPLLIAFSKVLVLYFLWKQRDFILSILTANRVSQLSNNVTRRISGAGNYLKDKASNNAMKRLKTVQGVTRRMGRNGVTTAGVGLTMTAGAMKLGGRKLLNKGVSKIKESQPGLSNTVGLYKSTLGDVGSRLSSVKHRLVGKAQHLQAEGLKGSYKHPDHKELRESSERNLQIAQDKKNQSLGYKVRKHNQETKERLLGHRQMRDGVNSGFREYAMRERAYQTELSKNESDRLASQKAYNQSTKKRLQQSRQIKSSRSLKPTGFKEYRIKENQTLSKLRKSERKRK
ncbi:TPA: hypothetical protein U2D46_001242 [Streptococcus suis]|nr:hypothetical protein [Streptococcus suis]AUC92709.1 hypothetical protein CWM22_12820 [Streptococcus suis]MCK3891228.1 hypothetical protein [Streptococcus suis]MDW8713231.1 hypothetical protein [Streptococcus suis]NQJ87455.1 hypothetical protein [Streptococcus suis]NQL53256.1 hypothetical protein [Streptococcus suis]